jgi:DNA gyrase/topoisomerase IV subunit B
LRDFFLGHQLSRAFQLFPAARQYVNGETYSILRRDRTLAENIPWYELPNALRQNLESGSGYGLQRFKGLGEMNAEQLWETTMDPERRILLQVNVEDAMRADTLFSNLMGDDVAPRKAYIQAHAASVRNLDV